MKEKDHELERQKNEFFKEYFDKTGRTWTNYYPRNPVEHFVYDITHIGQTFDVETQHVFYEKCPNGVLSQIGIAECQQTTEGGKKKTQPKTFF